MPDLFHFCNYLFFYSNKEWFERIIILLALGFIHVETIKNIKSLSVVNITMILHVSLLMIYENNTFRFN